MKHIYLLYTGYGKTKLCLDMIVNTNHKVLLISDKNIIETSWAAEINKWYSGKIKYKYITGRIKPEDRMKIIDEEDYDILGINTEMLSWFISHSTSVKNKTHTKSGTRTYYKTDELINKFDMLVLDEVSLFKNYNSNRFKLIKSWAHKIENVIALTATPRSKGIENLWAISYLIDGGERLGKSMTAFRNTYGIPIALPNGFNRYEYTSAVIDEILNKIKDICTSIPVPTTSLFPEPAVSKVMLSADPETTKLLIDFKDKCIAHIKGSTIIAFNRIQLLNKIGQIASGDVYTDFSKLHLHETKFNYVKRMLDKIDTPVLITYNYEFDREKLLTLPGARLLNSTQDFEDWNNDKIKVGVLSPFSASHGLNLQDSQCKDIIWFSPVWSSEKWSQLNARVCRRGQRFKVNIWVLLLKESFDEYIFDLCMSKLSAERNSLIKLQGAKNG